MKQHRMGHLARSSPLVITAVAVASAGPCADRSFASRFMQITTIAPHHLVLCRSAALPDAKPAVSEH